MRNTRPVEEGYRNFIGISQTSFEEAYEVLDKQVNSALKTHKVECISGAWRTQDDGGRCIYVAGQTVMMTRKK